MNHLQMLKTHKQILNSLIEHEKKKIKDIKRLIKEVDIGIDCITNGEFSRDDVDRYMDWYMKDLERVNDGHLERKEHTNKMIEKLQNQRDA